MIAHPARRVLGIAAVLALIASGCGGATAPTATPTKAPAAAPTATAAPRPAATSPATPAPASAATPTATPRPTAAAPAPATPSRTGARGSIVFVIGTRGSEVLDAHDERGGNERPVTREIYESLGGAGMERKIAPQLAESWEVSADGLAWTWHLRKGVKFHSGDPFDSQDAKFTVERIIQPARLHPQGVALGQLLDRVDAPDQYTVVWRLKRPFMQMLNHELWVTHISKRYLERNNDEILRTKPVGTGPFKFVSQVKGEFTELEAFEEHYMTPPTVKKVTLRIVPEDFTRVAMLKTGEADIVMSVPGSQVADLVRTPGVQLVEDLGGRYHLSVLDAMHPEPSPLKDVRVREAVSLAIDRKAMVDAIYFGRAKIQGSTFSPITTGHSPNMPPQEYNPAKAKQLLAAAGYPNGFAVDLTYSNQEIPAFQAIASLLREVGIQAKPVVMETGAYNGKFREKSLRGLARMTTGVYYDAGFVSETFLRPGGPWSYITDPKMTELDTRAGTTIDLAAREKVLQEMDRYIVDNFLVIGVVAPSALSAIGPRVKSYTPPPGVQTSQGMAFVRLKE